MRNGALRSVARELQKGSIDLIPYASKIYNDEFQLPQKGRTEINKYGEKD